MSVVGVRDIGVKAHAALFRQGPLQAIFSTLQESQEVLRCSSLAQAMRSLPPSKIGT